MANSYHKTQIACAKLNDEIVMSIVTDIKRDIYHSNEYDLGNSADDIYTCIKNMGYDIGNLKHLSTLNNAIKNRSKGSKALIEVLEKIVKEYTIEQEIQKRIKLETNILELGLTKTANPDYYVSNDKKYYKIADGVLEESPSVIDVDLFGYYTVVEKMGGKDKKIVTYNTDNKPVSLQIVNEHDRPYTSIEYIIKIFGLKKEYVKPYKMHGYCGNSSGLIASVGNLLASPIPSGCFSDKYFNFYKWNTATKRLEVQSRKDNQVGAPMVADYLVKDNIVIRTDYDGAGFMR